MLDQFLETLPRAVLGFVLMVAQLEIPQLFEQLDRFADMHGLRNGILGTAVVVIFLNIFKMYAV